MARIIFIFFFFWVFKGEGVINFLLAFPRLKDFEMKIKRSKAALRSNSKIFVFVLSMGKNKSVQSSFLSLYIKLIFVFNLFFRTCSTIHCLLINLSFPFSFIREKARVSNSRLPEVRKKKRMGVTECGIDKW